MELHPLRYVHFLLFSYVILSCFKQWPSLIRGPYFTPIVTVGQQSLATFMASLALSWAMGMALDVFGRQPVSVALANIVGLSAIFAIAYMVKWFKSKPWERPRAASTTAKLEPRALGEAATKTQPAE